MSAFSVVFSVCLCTSSVALVALVCPSVFFLFLFFFARAVVKVLNGAAARLYFIWSWKQVKTGKEKSSF